MYPWQYYASNKEKYSLVLLFYMDFYDVTCLAEGRSDQRLSIEQESLAEKEKIFLFDFHRFLKFIYFYCSG